jgi:hypothetical protein
VIQVHLGFRPFWVQSIRGSVQSWFSTFGVQSILGWLQSGLGPFEVQSIRGWVFLGSDFQGSVLLGSVGESSQQLSETVPWRKIYGSKMQRWASAILVCTSAIPQYCGLPNRLRNCGLKKVAELRLRTFKFDFRNSLQSLASSPTLQSLFLSSRCFKNQPIAIFTIICFNRNHKLALKGQ